VVTNDQHQVVCGNGKGSDDPDKILPVAEAAVAKTKTPLAAPKAKGAAH
jgi:hypothetical protein